MMKNLLRTMLVSIGLLASAGVWADTYEILYGTPTYDTDGTTVLSVAPQTDFTENALTDVSFSDANGNAEALPIGGSVLYAKTAWTKDFVSPVTRGKVYFAGNYSVSANNSNTFRIVDSNGYVIYDCASGSPSKNGTYTVATICGTDITNYVRQPRLSAYGIKSLCIDLAARTVTYDLLISSGANKTSELTGTVDLPSEVTDVKGLSVSKTNYGAYLDNVMLYCVTPPAGTYNYSIVAKDGDTKIKTLTEGICLSGSTYTVTLSKVIENDGKYYVLNDDNAISYIMSYTMGDADETKTINYTLDESIVYFAEAENKSTTDVSTENASQSNGGSAAAPASKGISLETFAAGTYEISTVVVSNGSRRGFYLHDSNNSDKNTYLFYAGEDKAASGEFTLDTETSLLVTGYTNTSNKYNQSARFDYVLIKRIQSPVTYTVSTTEVGLATLAPPYGLNFSNATKVAAYMASSVGDDVISLKKITNVAAGEGVLIRSLAGDATEEEIAIDASVTTKNDGNKFVGVLEDTNITSGYVLNSVDGDVSFYAADATNGTTVGANKAYLPATSSAKSLKITFDGETTGINEIGAVKASKSEAIFNLSGQRIAQPVKGLYIMNGKKVIVK